MIGHDLVQCRVFNAQNHVVGPQHKPSKTKKITEDNKEQGEFVGDPVVHKQHKEYRKKNPIEVIDLQNKIFDNSAGNLIATVSGGTKVGP